MELSAYSLQTNVLRHFSALRVLILFCSILATGLCLYFVKSAAGQDMPFHKPPAATELQSPNDTAQQPTAPPSTETKPKEKSKKTDTKKDDKKGAFVVAPLPTVSPAIGSGIVPIAAYIFPFQVKAKSSPPSVVAAAGLITNNGSRTFGFGADLYLKQARYELKLGYGRGNVGLQPLRGWFYQR
jgi:hypothetical protein